MTREEAIFTIEHRDSIMDYGETEQLAEALDMAIEALKAEPCEDAVSREAMLNGWAGIAKAKARSDAQKALMGRVMFFTEHLPPVTPKQRWIPVSEKLPNDRDWYLGIFKEPDTGWVNPLPFICDYVGHETKATTKEHWILRECTDRDERIDYYFNLECVAWMPLPEPYKEGVSE